MHSKKRKKKKKTGSGKICISCIALAVTAILSVQIVRLHHVDQGYQQEQQELEAQLEDEQQRSEDLEKQQEYVGTDQYVEDVARSKLGMVYQDEILFKED